jgi:plastocyanin
MRRAMLLCVIVGAAAFASGGTALAGGGCHEGATHADATGTDEVTVQMIDACFSTSITAVDPGTSVTFQHMDSGLTHNVSANGWGEYGEMRLGDTYRATFDEEGIYPFACTYHPGMIGAIVVGDGMGAGNGTAVSTESFDPATKAVQPVARAASRAPWIVTAGLGGLALGAALAFGLVRSRKAQTAS